MLCLNVQFMQDCGVLQVEFYAHWSPACVHLEPVFAGLSLRYRMADVALALLKLVASANWSSMFLTRLRALVLLIVSSTDLNSV